MTDPSPDCGYGPGLEILDAEGRPQRPLTRVGSYKLIEIRPFHTRTWREAIVITWGTDIFVGRIPLLKLTLALVLAINALFWWLLS